MPNSIRALGLFLIQKAAPAVVILAVGIGVLAAFGYFRPDPESVTPDNSVPTVLVTPAAPYDGKFSVEAHGLVVPHREIILAAEVASTIESKSEECQSGRWVPEGTVLITLDRSDLDITKKRLLAELKQAETQIKELDDELQFSKDLVSNAETEVARQQAEFGRLKNLLDRGRISKSEVDQSEVVLLKAQTALIGQKQQKQLLETRRARLVAAEELATVQIEKADLDLERTIIKAPSDGVIVMEEVEQGTYVQPGTRLLVFEDTTKAEVEFNLTVDELYWIMLDKRMLALPSGQEGGSFFQLPPIDDVAVEFTVENEVLRWRGKLDGFASYGVNEQTRNVPCRVIVDQPYLELNRGLGTLRRGMFVRLHIFVDPSVQMVYFPESALQAADRVWKVEQGNVGTDDKPEFADVLRSVDVRIGGRLSENEMLVINAPAEVVTAPDDDSKKRAYEAARRAIDQGRDNSSSWIIARHEEPIENADGSRVAQASNNQGSSGKSEEKMRPVLSVGDKIVNSPLTLPSENMQVNPKAQSSASSSEQSASTTEPATNSS